MDEPREVIIHPSLNRPHLLLGGDREAVLVVAMLALMIAISLSTWWGVFVATGLWFFCLGILIRMAKSDPQMRHVYLRHVRYRDFYAARSTLGARPPRLPSRWD